MQTTELPNIDFWMIHPNLKNAPVFSFPKGYSMRYFRDGDVQKWVEIQQAADSFFKATADTFRRTMPGETAYLAERIMFLVDPTGREIGSIAAWQTDRFDHGQIGQVHWVAITADHQGNGLARPMLSICCQQMLKLGRTQACLSTNTKRIPAVNLYRKFGFEPLLQTTEQKEAWGIITTKLKYEEIK